MLVPSRQVGCSSCSVGWQVASSARPGGHLPRPRLKGLVTVVGIEPGTYRMAFAAVAAVAKLDEVENPSSPSGGCMHRAGLLSASLLVGVGVVGWAGVGEGEGSPCVSQTCVLIFMPSAMVLQIRQRHNLFGLLR